MRRTLIVMMRAPRLGQVKTRLAEQVGSERALDAYIELLGHTRTEVEAVSAGGAVEVAVHVEGDRAHARALFGDAARYRAQPDGDLGVRLAAAFEDAFGRGAGAVCAIGVDCPELTAGLLDDAFAALGGETETRAAVLGPAEDGGYYLIGFTRGAWRDGAPGAFDAVAWSTDRVAATTRERLRAAGVPWVELAELYDVDRVAELERWRAEPDPLPGC